MPNLIQIKRSTTTATPPTLAVGELAWSELTQNLFIGESGNVVAAVAGPGTYLKKVDAYTKAETDTRIQAIVGAAPAALDTLSELAAALGATGSLSAQTCIVPHGLNPRFNKAPKLQRAIAEYDDAHPYRVLYVSIIDQYKHQWHVVEAVAALRKQGFPMVLDLVGPAYPPALKRLNQSIDRLDFERRWVHYHGAIPFNELHLRYAEADLGLFASSCENMPNILLETMASGLPIACSNRGPMPEVLAQTGVFFNPEQPEDIARALRELIESPQTRSELARASFERVQEYSWIRCADETFRFLVGVIQQRKKEVINV